MRISNNKRRCKAVTKSGKPCQAAPMEGGLCFFHANPDKARELGGIGGRKNRRVALEIADPLPGLNTVLGVRETNARVFDDLYAGKIDPRTATSLVRSLTLQLRAIEIGDLVRQLAEAQNDLKWLADAIPMLNKVVSEPTGNFNNQTVPSTEREENTPMAPIDRAS